MIGLGVVPGVLLVVGIYTQPERPRWLAVNKHDGRTARTVPTRLRGHEDAAEAELADIRAEARDEAERAQPLRLRMLTGGRLRTVFTVGLLLVFFQNVVGINTIIYYSPTLLANVGFGSSGAILANGGICAVNTLMTLPATRLIDRTGRRPLLLVGALGMCAAMVLLAVVNLGGMTKGPLLLGVALSGIAGYVASFSVSWGRVQWVALP